MPNSKSRTKKSRGKAWRRHRAWHAPAVAPVHSRPPASPAREAPLETDEYDDWDDWSFEDEWDDDGPDEHDEEVFTDGVLGDTLLARGWVDVGANDHASDCWGYPRTRADGRVVMGTSICVIGVDRYLVVSYGGEPVVWSGFYDNRDDVIADIEAIEAHRRPQSLTSDR